LTLIKRTGSSKPEPKGADGDKKLKSLKAPTKQKRYKSVSSSSIATVKIDTSSSKVDKELEAFLSLSKKTTIEILKKLLQQIKLNKSKQLEKIRTQLIDCVRAIDLCKTMRRILDQTFLPLAKKIYDNSLLNTNSTLARCQLSKLKNQKLRKHRAVAESAS
jgi:hypothetical protein